MDYVAEQIKRDVWLILSTSVEAVLGEKHAQGVLDQAEKEGRTIKVRRLDGPTWSKGAWLRAKYSRHLGYWVEVNNPKREIDLTE